MVFIRGRIKMPGGGEVYEIYVDALCPTTAAELMLQTRRRLLERLIKNDNNKEVHVICLQSQTETWLKNLGLPR